MNDADVHILTLHELDRHRSDIQDMLEENMYKFHYPEAKVDHAYIAQRFEDLKGHVANGNTYVIGALRREKLLGFIWVYTRPFANHRRMIVNALFIAEPHRGQGLGRRLMHSAEALAVECGCQAMSTHYAIHNKTAEAFYAANDLAKTRVEVVKSLDDRT